MYTSQCIPLTEETRLQIVGSRGLTRFLLHLLRDGDCVYTRETLFEILRLPKILTSFHGSPRIYQTRFVGSPQQFKQGFTLVNGVPVTQKSVRQNRTNLEIQIL